MTHLLRSYHNLNLPLETYFVHQQERGRQQRVREGSRTRRWPSSCPVRPQPGPLRHWAFGAVCPPCFSPTTSTVVQCGLRCSFRAGRPVGTPQSWTPNLPLAAGAIPIPSLSTQPAKLSRIYRHAHRDIFDIFASGGGRLRAVNVQEEEECQTRDKSDENPVRFPAPLLLCLLSHIDILHNHLGSQSGLFA